MWSRPERVAIAFGPNQVRLLVARGNGNLRPLHEAATPLPEGSLRPGLVSSNIAQPEAVAAALHRLLQGAREAGTLRKRPELVAVVLADAAVKLTIAPVEGAAPSRGDGVAMARWILRDLLPIPVEEARIDWAMLPGQRSNDAGEEGPPKWLLAVACKERVIEEYETVVEQLGWSVGRIVPWTLALSVGGDSADRAAASGGDSADRAAASGGDGAGRAAAASDESVEPATRLLLLCDTDGSLACLVEADGLPRFHRAWRRGVVADKVGAELETLQHYITDRLELSLRDAWLCGASQWVNEVGTACTQLGWRTQSFSHTTALLGALQG